METHQTIIFSLFFTFFLLFTAFILKATKKFSFLPYTVALLFLGLAAQYIDNALGFHFDFHLSHDVIYYILLPALLFESAFQINFHQFKLQFKTITFVATFGLLLSIFAIGAVLVKLIGLPWKDAFLFGAIISATDPIAVITMFKTLGAPKRLALLAEGESMLNDATGVIAFRIISAFVISANTDFGTLQILEGMQSFIYIFTGSIVFGLILGYLASRLIETTREDKLVTVTLTGVLALGSFAASELFFHLSGVISTVISALVLGNLAKTKMSKDIREFSAELWEYFAFLSVSLVFFFATYNLDITIFQNNITSVFIAVFAVLIGRAVSVYTSVAISNYASFFKNEPNVPLSWQHILNWGGLRGVIPLVLLYSLPESYKYYDLMLIFTLGSFLFTLLVNGLTIRSLLFKLKLHVPRNEERIMQEQKNILHLEYVKNLQKHLEPANLEPEVLKKIKSVLMEEEQQHKSMLESLAHPEALRKSLLLQSLINEKTKLEELYEGGYINQNVYYDFEAELDMQLDAIEYPEVYVGRNVLPGGKIETTKSFRKRLKILREYMARLPFLKYILQSSKAEIIEERIGLLKARIATSESVIEHLLKLQNMFEKNAYAQQEIKTLIQEHHALTKENEKELKNLITANKEIYHNYQTRLAYSFIYKK